MDTAQELIVQKLISSISEQQASDLHISVGVPPMLRIDGELKPITEQGMIDINFVKSLCDAWLNKTQKEKLLQEKEITFAYNFKDKARFKVTIISQQNTYSISLKLIPENIIPFNELGFPPVVKEIIEKDKGLIIIAGAYNAGRSSTLGSMIENINQNFSKRIITIEKPIEHIFIDNKSIIEQREVEVDVLSYESGLKNLIQEDVQVVMLHSMEKPSVIKEAMNVASSGRQVFAAINSDTTVSAIKKIINSFSSDDRKQVIELLSGNLSLAIAQKILPRIDGGQVLAYEILIPNRAIKGTIEEGDLRQLNNFMQTSKGEGMITMDQKLADLVNNGIIQRETGLENAVVETDFLTYLRA